MKPEELLHSDAMDKVATVNAKGITKGLKALAMMAHESGAQSSSATLNWLREDEEVAAAYVPELILRVYKP